MRKPYAVYLVVTSALCLIGLWGVVRILGDGQAKLAAIQAETQTVEKSASELEAIAAKREALLAMAEAKRESAELAARIKATMEAEAARINAEEAARPKPAPVTGWAPNGKVYGRVFTNDSLMPAPALPPRSPESGSARVIVDFAPRDADGIVWQDAVRSGRCAAFSFRDANGKTVNRLYCDPVVARR